MGKRGKQPAIARSTPKVQPLDNRPEPPKSLGKRAKEVWISVVNALPKNHLCAAELPILRTYCVACETVERLEASFASGQFQDFVPAGINSIKYHPAHNLISVNRTAMAQAATKLKLTASSRMDRRVAGRNINDISAAGGDTNKFAGLMFQDIQSVGIEQ